MCRSVASFTATELFPQAAVLGRQLIGGPLTAPPEKQNDEDHGDNPSAQDGQDQNF
jgi:hypothetical protein